MLLGCGFRRPEVATLFPITQNNQREIGRALHVHLAFLGALTPKLWPDGLRYPPNYIL
jgi:hypothetical protein